LTNINISEEEVIEVSDRERVTKKMKDRQRVGIKDKLKTS
jgi:hypothetical protein